MQETMAPKTPVSKKFDENAELLKKELGIGLSYDIGWREFEITGKKAALLFVDGLIKDDPIVEIMQNLAFIDREELAPNTLHKLVTKYITYVKALPTDKLEDVVNKVLSGFIALIVDGLDQVILIEARQYPSRSPQEPDIERVVRGSRDGFVETILFNTALIRRRLRDPRLRTEMLQAGARSKTDICVAYLEDVANPDLVKTIKNRIKDIKIDGLPMAEKSVEEFITTNSWNPLPQVRYTERPDVAATHLLQGHVLILVDTSPSIIIAPVTYFHHLQHAEEFRQNAFIGAYLRWIRYFAVFFSVFILPLWYLAAIQPGLLPEALKFIGPEKIGRVPLILQVILAEIGLDMIRLSTIHTPSPLATALGLIAAFMIGDIAISVGLFAPEIILYLAIAAVGTFATPSYELGMANRIFRLFLVLMVAVLRLPGLLIGVGLILILLARTKPFGISYLWPLIPFNWRALKAIMVRPPIPMQNTRPSFLKPQDQTRQPNLSPARKKLPRPGRKKKESNTDNNDREGLS